MRLREIRNRGPRPGTPAFGEQAHERLERLRSRERQGDLRIKTANKTVGEARDVKDRYLAGD